VRRLVTSFMITGFLILGTTSCAFAPRYEEPPSYRNDYYYYPHARVYYHLYSGYYHYPEGRDWIRARVLPANVLLDQRARRVIVVEGRKPYQWHNAHRKRFKLTRNFALGWKPDQAERLHNHRQHLRYRRRPEEWQRR